MMATTTSNTELENKRDVNTVLFVGSNPANASVCDIAFHASTHSSRILSEWCKDIRALKVHVNVLNQKTENNRPLKKTEIKLNLERLRSDIECIAPDRIVALGKTAATALSMLGVEYFEMPHPSGRNRLLNDPKYLAEKVKGLVEYCSPQAPDNSCIDRA